jgi:hypothetical protein
VATLTSLQTALQTKLGIPSGDALLTTTVQTAFINEALHKLEGEGEWQWQEGTETLNAVITNSTLTPSSTNYSKTKHLSVTTGAGAPLELKDISFLDKLANASGEPVFYGFWAGLIQIRPKADASYSFTHRYLKREVDLVSGSDTPLVPDRWIPAVVEYAACLCYRRINDADNAARALAAYQDWVGRAAEVGDLKATESGGGVDRGAKQQADDL